MRAPTLSRPAAVDDADRRRFARRRRMQRLVALRPYLIAVLVVALVAGLGWLAFFSPVLATRGVRVQGTQIVDPVKVREVGRVPMDVPLARVDTDAIAARVQDLAAVQSVEVSRCWPHDICIAVTERSPVAVVDKEGALWALDSTGILFRRYSARPRGLPLVQMRAATDTEALAEVAQVVTALPASLLGRVRLLDVATLDKISLELKRGASVTWGSAEDSANKAAVLGVLLRTQPGAREYDVGVAAHPTVRP